MHCLSAREYRVGVDVVADAVQVLSLHIESTKKEHCIDSKIFFFGATFSFDFHNLDLISSVNVPGSLECRACWNPTDPDKYGTGEELKYLKLQTLDKVQTANKLELLNLVFISTTTTYKGHFSWWAR